MYGNHKAFSNVLKVEMVMELHSLDFNFKLPAE